MTRDWSYEKFSIYMDDLTENGWAGIEVRAEKLVVEQRLKKDWEGRWVGVWESGVVGGGLGVKVGKDSGLESKSMGEKWKSRW